MKNTSFIIVFVFLFFTKAVYATEYSTHSFAGTTSCNLWMSNDYVDRVRADIISVTVTPKGYRDHQMLSYDTINLSTKGFLLDGRQNTPDNKYLEGAVDSSDSLCPEVNDLYQAYKKLLHRLDSNKYYRTQRL